MKVIIEFKTIPGIPGTIGLMNSAPIYKSFLAACRFSKNKPKTTQNYMERGISYECHLKILYILLN